MTCFYKIYPIVFCSILEAELEIDNIKNFLGKDGNLYIIENGKDYYTYFIFISIKLEKEFNEINKILWSNSSRPYWISSKCIEIEIGENQEPIPGEEFSIFPQLITGKEENHLSRIAIRGLIKKLKI